MEELLLYLLKSAGLLSIFLLVYQLLLRNDTSFQANRHFLLGGILAAAVLPAVEFTRTVILPVATSGTVLPVSSGPAYLPEPSFELNWWEIAGYCYAIITSVLLLKFLFQLYSLLRIIWEGQHSKEDGLTIIRTSRELLPFSFFHYIVLNPGMHAEEDLKNILEHEKTHASQWHSADVLLANLATALLWFNPLSWWYRKSLVQNLEYLADRETVAAVPKNEYQHTLVKLAVSNHQPVLANNFYQSLIKKRILMLNKTKNQNPSLWKFGAIVPLLLVFMFAFNVKTEAQVHSGHSKITEISVVVSPGATEKSLEGFGKFFKSEKDIELKFSDIQRSSEGLITNINARLKTATGEEKFYYASDPKGIKAFGVVSNEESTYFTDSPVIPSKDALNPLAQIGNNPLFFIEGKEYTSAELEGKMIRLSGTVTARTGSPVEEEYGPKAKDGVVIIDNGDIMEYAAALEEMDAAEGRQDVRYIWVSANGKPLYLTVSATITINDSEATPDAKDINASLAPDKKAKVTFMESADPLIVVNGEVKSADFNVNSINPEDIATINVLKDKSAEALYGTEAGKRGVVVIVTKVYAKEAGTSGKSSENAVEITQKGEDSFSFKFSGDKKMEFSQKDILYVVNGKVMKKDFDPESINPDDIESINVLKGEIATDAYGKKAAKGVIEIRTKE